MNTRTLTSGARATSLAARRRRTANALYVMSLGLAAAGCKRGDHRPAGAGSGSAMGSGSSAGAGTESGSAGSVHGLATPLSGPFATLDAYCATRATSDDRTCEAVDTAPVGDLPAGLLQAAAVYETSDEHVGCGVALRTSAGWFVGPPSDETCREPSYVELEAIDVDTDGAIAAITFGVDWHTNSSGEDADEAKYKLTALCGTGRGDVPACTPVFLRQCEPHAPTTGCATEAFELAWTLDDDRATFKGSRPIDNDAVPTGEHAIVGDR